MAEPIVISIEVGHGITVAADVETFEGTNTVKSTTYSISADGEQGRPAMLHALARAIRLCTLREAVELVELIRHG